MTVTSFKKLSFLFLFFALAFVACDSEDDATLVDTENFTDEVIKDLQTRSGVGKHGCFEFVFPIQIEFADGTNADIEDYEDLYTTVKAWYEENRENYDRRPTRPRVVLPVQIMNADGELVDIEERTDFLPIIEECGGRFGKWRDGHRGNRGRGYHCYSLVFPVTLNIGGAEQSFEDKASMREAIRAYRAENGRDAERPSLVFPINVEDEDGNTMEVASREDLIALKESCSE